MYIKIPLFLKILSCTVFLVFNLQESHHMVLHSKIHNRFILITYMKNGCHLYSVILNFFWKFNNILLGVLQILVNDLTLEPFDRLCNRKSSRFENIYVKKEFKNSIWLPLFRLWTFSYSECLNAFDRTFMHELSNICNKTFSWLKLFRNIGLQNLSDHLKTFQRQAHSVTSATITIWQNVFCTMKSCICLEKKWQFLKASQQMYMGIQVQALEGDLNFRSLHQIKIKGVAINGKGLFHYFGSVFKTGILLKCIAARVQRNKKNFSC